LKKAIWLFTIPVLLMVLATFAGCGGSTGASGKATGNTSTGAVTESQLGVPIYPGATKEELQTAPRQQAEDSSVQSSETRPGPDANGRVGGPGNMGARLATLWTADSTDKVVAWYRTQLKGKSGFNETTLGGGGFAPPGGQQQPTGGSQPQAPTGATPGAQSGVQQPQGSNGSQAQSSDFKPPTVFTFKSGDTTKVVMIRTAMQDKGGTSISIMNSTGEVPTATPNQGQQPQGDVGNGQQ